MLDVITDAQGIVDRLAGAGVAATLDPAQAATNRPCILVTPPTLDTTSRSATWRLAALSGHDAGNLAALTELLGLVQLAETVLPVEGADPASYPLTPETGTVPAYLIRLTTSY